MSKRKELKVGDLVRITAGGAEYGSAHAVGAVGEVVEWPNRYGNVTVKVGTLNQGLGRECVKLATQAMKKRDMYEARRG